MNEQEPNSFHILLSYLDPDELAASEKYLTLHLKLTKSFIWKGCPEFAADNLADETLERTARKLNETEEKLAKGIREEKGEKIRKVENISAFVFGISRLVWLEYWRRHLKPRVESEDGELPEIIVSLAEIITCEPDLRLQCLRKCLDEKIPEEKDRRLILGYYNNEFEEKNKEIRKSLAETFGITMINLKVKACRLRERLEKCINECVRRSAVTKTSDSDIDKKEIN